MRQVTRSMLVALATVVAAAGATGTAGAQGKIGYVNTQAVIAQTPARATAEAEFNKRFAPLNAEAQKMDSTWKSMLAAFARDTTLQPSQREAKAQQLQQQQTQFQTRMQAIEDSAAALRQRLMQPIMQQLEKALEDVRKEGGYAIIFDVGQQGAAPIVAADTTLDVTARVIAKMKSMPAPASGTASAPSAARPQATGPVAAPAGATTRPPSRR
ncbi:MAG TPA: OmpH family outer membrane protein [Gemmatimonadaceae bacterium]|nr:OmpH family outer membrane protein [Gemmatimonadaceae bacterium]